MGLEPTTLTMAMSYATTTPMPHVIAYCKYACYRYTNGPIEMLIGGPPRIRTSTTSVTGILIGTVFASSSASRIRTARVSTLKVWRINQLFYGTSHIGNGK